MNIQTLFVKEINLVQAVTIFGKQFESLDAANKNIEYRTHV